MSTSENSTGPSRLFYALGTAAIVSGAVVLGVLLFTKLPNLAPDIQVVVPGIHEIQLSEAGSYTIFYEYRSLVDGRIFASGQSLSDMSVQLRAKDGPATLGLSTPSGSATCSPRGGSINTMRPYPLQPPTAEGPQLA